MTRVELYEAIRRGYFIEQKSKRGLAREHGVPLVENPPLARALHAGVDLEGPVPAEHYRAVAEIIGYVWRLKGRAPAERSGGR